MIKKEKFKIKNVRGTKKCKRCGQIIVIKSRLNTSSFCRHCYVYEWTKKKRKERVKKKYCASCGKKVKPIKIIPYRCEDCQDKIREYTKKKKLRK